MSDSKHRPHPAAPGAASRSKHDGVPKQRGAVVPEAPPQAEAGKSGRVAFDSRGNPTWEWQTSTGVFDRNVTTQRLKKLEAKELSIADTQSLPKPKGLALEEPTVLPGDGMNPYNSGGPSHKATVAKHLPKPQPRPAPAVKSRPPAKPTVVATPKAPSAWQRIKSKLMRAEDSDDES